MEIKEYVGSLGRVDIVADDSDVEPREDKLEAYKKKCQEKLQGKEPQD